MIRRLHVTNFKSLRDFSLTLGTRNVLVGANMAGKSNVISVFRFLAQMVFSASGVNGLEQAFLSQGGFADVVWRGGDSNLISLSLEGDFGSLEEGGEETTWEYAIQIAGDRRSGSITVQDESLRCSGPGGQATLIDRDPSSGRRVFRDIRGGAITLVSEAKRSALEFELPDWDGNRLRRLFASFRFYNLVPQVMKQTNPMAATPFLDIMGANLSAWLMMLQTRYREESFDSINSVAKDVSPDLASLLTWPMPQSTVFLASMERHLKSAVPVWQMADGELCEALMHHRIIEGRLFPFPNGVDVHATHQETETWLLADAGAIGRVAQLRSGRAVVPVRDPLEAIVRPKERFQALLSSARLPYTPDVCRAIARATDLDILRQRCPSFSRFAQKLQ